MGGAELTREKVRQKSLPHWLDTAASGRPRSQQPGQFRIRSFVPPQARAFVLRGCSLPPARAPVHCSEHPCTPPHPRSACLPHDTRCVRGGPYTCTGPLVWGSGLSAYWVLPPPPVGCRLHPPALPRGYVFFPLALLPRNRGQHGGRLVGLRAPSPLEQRLSACHPPSPAELAARGSSH